MRIMVAQLNPLIGDLDGNTQKIINAILDAKEKKADIVLFPELTICGYAPDDLLLHRNFINSMEQHLEQIINKTRGITAVVGLARRNTYKGEKALFNSAAVIQNGELLGFQDKWLLPNYDVFRERRYFEPGHDTKVWHINGKRVGIIICEDIWKHSGYVDDNYERDPVLAINEYKPDVLLNLSASPYQYQKPHTRAKVCGKAAKTLNCPVILCCQVGANDQLIFDGYSIYVDENGHLRQLAKGFEEDFMMVDLEAKACPCPFEYDSMSNLFSALQLGVKDYFRKSGFQKAVLGLSGGIDSAVVAVIAKEALGSENVIGVAMPSQYSSEGSVKDAEKLAKNLGIEFHLLPIESVFHSYKDMLAPQFKDLPEDVTEENIQARIRGMTLMALSNKFNYIVLSTGNKSELALGYCTLYGDMCGGLGVIADVSKTKVYDLARWYNRNGEIIPEDTITKPPSAELRPGQIDLDSLPDYQIIDNVLEGYVEDYLTNGDISKKYDIPAEIVSNLIRKIHRAEYKRRQGPPILRVSKKSFGVGRSYPIVQGWR